MSETINVQGGKRIVVPIRFTRAVTGMTKKDAPDVDDRGFVMGKRPWRWNKSEARSAQVGIMVGDEVRVKLLREDLSQNAKLYIVSDNPAACKVTDPPKGEKLDSHHDTFKIKGVSNKQKKNTRIQVHVGSADGPVIGELEPHVFARRRISVKPYLVRIDQKVGVTVSQGTEPLFSDEDIKKVIDEVRAIWRPCGVDFKILSTVKVNIVLRNKDTVTMPAGGSWAEEIKKVFDLQLKGKKRKTRKPYIHWYVINGFLDLSEPVATQRDTAGIGFNLDFAKRLNTCPGIITRQSGIDFRTNTLLISHEIGHFFKLDHPHLKHADDPAKDSYSRRQLMYPILGLNAAHASPGLTNLPRLNDHGYGSQLMGTLILIKNLKKHNTDNETATVINTIQKKKWY